MPVEAAPRGTEAGRSPRSTAGFLRRCLDILRQHDATRYAEVRTHLRQIPAGYRVGPERFTVAVRGDDILVSTGATRSIRVEVVTTAREIVLLVDGRESVTRLLANDRLRIWGDAEALLDLSSAIRIFSAAAIGSGQIQQQFESYRSWVLQRPDER